MAWEGSHCAIGILKGPYRAWIGQYNVKLGGRSCHTESSVNAAPLLPSAPLGLLPPPTLLLWEILMCAVAIWVMTSHCPIWMTSVRQSREEECPPWFGQEGSRWRSKLMFLRCPKDALKMKPPDLGWFSLPEPGSVERLKKPGFTQGQWDTRQGSGPGP